MKIFAVFTLLLSIFVGISAWSFWEPKGFTKGSLAYSLKLPHAIKDIDTIGAISEPQYQYHVGDGMKPMIIAREYQSDLSVSEFLEDATAQGYSCENFPQDLYARCDKQDKQVQIQKIIISYPNKQGLLNIDHSFIGF